MAIEHEFEITFRDGGTAIQVSKTYEVGAAQSVSEAIGSSAADQLIAFTLDVSQLKTFLMYSEDSDLTIETNSSSSPGQTITLEAGVPFEWRHDSGVTNPLTPDITALYVTNTGAVATTLEIRAGYDPTV